MTTYLPDAAHLALCDAICDSPALCAAFGVPDDPIIGMPATEAATFALADRLDLFPASFRADLEAEALREKLLDLLIPERRAGGLLPNR